MRKLMAMLFLLPVVSFVYAQKNADSSSLGGASKQDTAATATIKENELESIPVISLDDDASATQNISSPFAKGMDPFYTATHFSFSPTRFLIRGYNRDNSITYMNGVPMEDLSTGFAISGQWSGLSDEMHNRYVSLGLENNTFGFGGIGANTNLDTRASKQRAQTSISYGRTNSFVKNDTRITHTTGMNSKGWAFTVSGSRRYSDEGYVPGTYYNGWSYFVGVDKKIGKRQLLSFVAFAAPSESGAQGYATKESYALAGSNFYNPNWGYQDGKKRDATVVKGNQPVGILTHEFTINKKTSLLTAVSYSFGNKSRGGFDWYDAPNPAPNYYTYLPSYQTNFSTNNPQWADSIAALLKGSTAARQINWQNIYNANRMDYTTIQNAGGISGNNVSGNRSLYILSARVTNSKKFNFNTTLNSTLSNNLKLTAGLSYQAEKDNNYLKVTDLLGGDFYVDVDQYAQLDFPGDPLAYQNNVNAPNRILHVGDKYGYNYDIDVNKVSGWAQLAAHVKQLDLFGAVQLSNSAFWRVGNVENGLFPTSSLGKSFVNDFTDYAVKLGATYKIDRQDFLYLNGGLLTNAPDPRDAYLDPQIRNTTQNNLKSQNIATVEGGYILNTPKIKLKLSGYCSSFKNGFQVQNFYSYLYNEYVDYVLSNVSTLNFGGELGAEAKVTKNVTVSAAASVGRDYYDSRQQVNIVQDNSNTSIYQGTVYIKNYRVPNTPQEAYNLSVNYHSQKFWFVTLSGNYFDQMWVEPNPERLTAASVQGIDPKLQSGLYGSILNQEKYAGQFTLDLRAGHSWMLRKITKKPLFFSINGGVNNLLDNKNIVAGGYQGERDAANINGVFDTKYIYAEGINYFIKATLRFY
jgi:hypothetical protein